MNNTKKNNQLQAFLTEYSKGNVLIADNGVIEEIEQSNITFTMNILKNIVQFLQVYQET